MAVTLGWLRGCQGDSGDGIQFREAGPLSQWLGLVPSRADGRANRFGGCPTAPGRCLGRPHKTSQLQDSHLGQVNTLQGKSIKASQSQGRFKSKAVKGTGTVKPGSVKSRSVKVPRSVKVQSVQGLRSVKSRVGSRSRSVNPGHVPGHDGHGPGRGPNPGPPDPMPMRPAQGEPACWPARCCLIGLWARGRDLGGRGMDAGGAGPGRSMARLPAGPGRGPNRPPMHYKARIVVGRAVSGKSGGGCRKVRRQG